MNGLVYIGEIIEIKEIPDANKIEAVTVVCGIGGKWSGVVQKNQFNIGDLCEVYLQDSLLPQTPAFSFMKKHNWRIKMSRFLGVPSEALIMPLMIDGYVGYDITDLVGVTKYEKEWSSGKDTFYNFPSFIPKTAEPLFQRVPEMVQALQGKPFYASIKMDGSSSTMYRYMNHFGVCNRTVEIKSRNNPFWEHSEPYADVIPEGYAVQFELVGPDIVEGNPVGLEKVSIFAFNVYHIPSHEYLSYHDFNSFCHDNNIPTVPVISSDSRFHFDDEGLRRFAEQSYVNQKPAEGIVIRPLIEQRINNERLSFKVINLKYRD